MGNYFTCENCGFEYIRKNVNYCQKCGYPTPKRLNEVENPQSEIDRALQRPYTSFKRIQYHGLINCMMEDMKPEEAEQFKQDLSKTYLEKIEI